MQANTGVKICNILLLSTGSQLSYLSKTMIMRIATGTTNLIIRKPNLIWKNSVKMHV